MCIACAQEIFACLIEGLIGAYPRAYTIWSLTKYTKNKNNKNTNNPLNMIEYLKTCSVLKTVDRRRTHVNVNVYFL